VHCRCAARQGTDLVIDRKVFFSAAKAGKVKAVVNGRAMPEMLKHFGRAGWEGCCTFPEFGLLTKSMSDTLIDQRKARGE
jgi:hypothetical protein